MPAEILQKRHVCVVGNRVNVAQHAKDNFPAFLGDYWDIYVSPKAAKPATPDTFLGYIVEARKKWAETGTGNEPYNLAISGILALIRRASFVEPEKQPRSKTALYQSLLQGGCLGELQRVLWQLINPADALEKHKWADCMDKILPLIVPSKPSQELLDFLSWENCSGALPVSGKKSAIQTEGIYIHRMGSEMLPIRFNSIHGVKGETHAATLVVETFARQHDLKELLPVLTATQHSIQLKDVARGHCKRIFVGMTRPSHLLCLAIYSEHISDAQSKILKVSGWNVVNVQ